MDKKEAKEIIANELKPYRDKPYYELSQMVGANPIVYEVSGSKGTTYQIEIEVFWDGKLNENIRVVGGIDDGGWRAFLPVCDDFIKSPTDEFIGK